ncbi:MAG: hypothetical protein ACYC9S_12195 [Leptospirales bacterium]
MILDILLAPIRKLKPREWLIVLAGLLVGLMVSAMFKAMVSHQKPASSERPDGPLSTIESPRMFSLKNQPKFHDVNLDLLAVAFRESAHQTWLEVKISFHPPASVHSLEIGSYEPPNFVESDGRMVLGTFDPPPYKHFHAGETYETLVSFPDTPHHLPITVTLFMGERVGGRFHMKPVVLTGLSPQDQAHSR